MPPVMVRRVMADFSQSHSVVVGGSLEDCFAVLTDFETYPMWSGPVTECAVLDRYGDGLARRVSFTLDMTLKTIRYVLEYTYEPPHTARWRLVESDDVKNVEGSYRFEKVGGQTRATCSQAIDIGFWVPGAIRRPLEQKALRDSVEDFKRAVENRRG